MDMNYVLAHLRFHYAGLFVLLVLGGLGLPFPEDATLILTGVLIATHVVKFHLAIPTVFAGVLITDVMLYAFGRQYGRRVVEHRGFRKVLSPARIAYLEEKFKKWGVWVVLIGRHLVGLRAQILIMSGVLGMSLWEFVLADGFSSMFTVAVMVFIGYKGGESLQVFLKDIKRVEHAGIAAVVVAVFIFVVYKYVMSVRGKAAK